MASFRKRDNGTYQASIYTGRDAKGKQLFEYATRNTLKECKAAAREIEERIAKTNFTDLRRIKTTDWLAEWIELNRNRLSPGTINIYKIYLQAHFIPYFGNIKLDKLNEIHIRRFMAEKLETLSPNTVRKLMSFLNKSLREALKDNNPVKDIQLPGKKKYTPHVVTDEELRQLLTIVKGSVDEIIILLAAWCGLRRGEICALKLNDVFERDGVIEINESMTINDEYDYVFKEPKSENGFRKVIVPEYLMNLIKEHIKTMRKEGGTNTKLFNYLPNSYSQRFQKIINDNGLPSIRFHDLRHYHASYLYNSGVPDHYVADRLGHDIQTLRSIYQHLGLKRKTEIDNVIKMIQPGINHAQQNAQQKD